MVLTIMEKLEEMFGGIRDFVVEKGENPWFWIIAFFAGIALFYFTYNALHRD